MSLLVDAEQEGEGVFVGGVGYVFVIFPWAGRESSVDLAIHCLCDHYGICLFAAEFVEQLRFEFVLRCPKDESKSFY